MTYTFLLIQTVNIMQQFLVEKGHFIEKLFIGRKSNLKCHIEEKLMFSLKFLIHLIGQNLTAHP